MAPYPGLFYTGDGAARDEHGYIWIKGRIDGVYLPRQLWFLLMVRLLILVCHGGRCDQCLWTSVVDGGD